VILLRQSAHGFVQNRRPCWRANCRSETLKRKACRSCQRCSGSGHLPRLQRLYLLAKLYIYWLRTGHLRGLAGRNDFGALSFKARPPSALFLRLTSSVPSRGLGSWLFERQAGPLNDSVALVYQTLYSLPLNTSTKQRCLTALLLFAAGTNGQRLAILFKAFGYWYRIFRDWSRGATAKS
jgi:hypothetical protein